MIDTSTYRSSVLNTVHFLLLLIVVLKVSVDVRRMLFRTICILNIRKNEELRITNVVKLFYDRLQQSTLKASR